MNLLEISKWTATVLLIIGFTGVSAGYWSMIYIQLTGGIIWLACAVAMKDRPLVVTNGVMTLGGIGGLLWNFLGG